MDDSQEHSSAKDLREAQIGFDLLFSNEIDDAKQHLATNGSAFHTLGLGVCTFLQAALGMEKDLMAEATRVLTLSEAESRKMVRAPPAAIPGQRFAAGLEYEVLNADATILLGLTNALSESYMGYLNCMYSLNSLYKSVYPTGLDGLRTPADTPLASPTPSRKSSSSNLRKSALTVTPSDKKQAKPSGSFFGRWGGSPSRPPTPPQLPDGPVEELILSGTAFGYGLFNLVFSLLPKGVQSVVGFLGFKHDRKLALQSLAVSAEMKDVHGAFSSLILMTYHGLVLLLTGYQADEKFILKQYRAIVDSIDSRYPDGALWILNKAKILRMTYDSDGAIAVLEKGLSADRKHTFAQADTLLAFELAWTYLSQRRYKDAAETFLKLVTLNQWSHGTYYYIAAGCYISLGDIDKAQELFDKVPGLMDKKKIGGKDLPTEVFIKKRLEFYKEKQKRHGGDEAKFAQVMKLSPADEIAIFWNTHTRISADVAQAHVDEWTALTPPPLSDASAAVASCDMDSVEELVTRSLFLGIVHRTLGHFEESQKHFDDAINKQSQLKLNTWVPGIALFESAVCDLREIEAASSVSSDVNKWTEVLAKAEKKLDKALVGTGNVDLGNRLDSRIALQKDEIQRKRELLGLGTH